LSVLDLSLVVEVGAAIHDILVDPVVAVLPPDVFRILERSIFVDALNAILSTQWV
jgi:hypothetical protein